MCNTQNTFTRIVKTAIVIASMMACAIPLAAQNYKVAPSSLSISWSQIAVNMPSNGSTISITNTGTTAFTVGSFSITPSQFHLIDGYAPFVVQPGGTLAFQINFVPNAAQTYNGTFTATINGSSTPIVVNLTGTGKKTLAVAQVSPGSLSFSQPLGTSSTQNVTLTNIGTSNMTLNGVTVAPPFSTTPFTTPVLIKPGASVTYPVSYFANSTNSSLGSIYFTLDVVAAKGATLTGVGLDSGNFVVTTYSPMPTATQKYAYMATLLASGGTAPFTWTLADGSSLPTGLSLSSAGTITGTVASAVAVGNHPFTVQVTDSSAQPLTATATITLPVSAPSGAQCGNIVTYANGSPLVPLTDLLTGTYFGSIGGLYSDGSNNRPPADDADGMTFANSIQPLDANGNPDPNGKYALIAIGMSTAHTDFDGFIAAAQADPSTNSKLVIVNAAMNGVLAQRYSTPTDPVWSSVMNYILPQSGVTANQVVAAWVAESDAISSGTYPSDMTALQGQLSGIAQELHTFFPNLKVAYYSPRYYTGYSNGISHPANDEPYAYESGFAVKSMITNQIAGDPKLNYNQANGPVKAPWLTWGPYYWANGLLARSDGLTYNCEDYKPDGNHPSDAAKAKDANQLLNFFKTENTATPWFLAH